MPVKSWTPGKEIFPRGMWSVLAQKRKGTPGRGSYAQNIRVKPGPLVGPRPGTTKIADIPVSIGRIATMFNWIPPSGENLLLYQDGNTVKSYDLTTSTGLTLLGDTSTSRATSFADFNIWTYFCGYDTSSNGVYQVRIFDGTNTDIAFRGPVTLTAASAVDGGPGECSLGQHFIGFVYQNRTGYSGVPSTTVAGVPISVTLTTDARLINISVTLPALTDAGGDSTLFLIMTTADNAANWFFIPTDTQTGSIGEQPVPYNTPVTLNFVASLSDEDINASADSANSQFLLLTQSPDGTGPFNPSFVVPYGSRMCYGAGVNLYISDPQNPQSITGDQNLVTLPSKRKIGYAFPLPGSTSLYLTGDRWTGYVTDNSDVPGTWPSPILVSGSLGTDWPNCVCFKTAGNYSWVVTEAGPYSFNGIYDERPLTFLVSDLWKRVNWKGGAQAIQIVDDVIGLKMYLGVPMDGATENNFQFTFDYQNTPEGSTPSFDQIDIGLDVYNPATFAALAIVKEPATGLSNLWIGPAATGGSIKHLDESTFDDDGLAVDQIWETGLVRGSEISTSMIRLGPSDLWIRGNGPLGVILYGPDKTQSQVLQVLRGAGIPISGLTPNPGIQFATKGDMSKVENATFQFRNNTLGGWFELSMVRVYMRSDIANR